MYKINFDAAVLRSTNSAGVGVVRNWRGELVGVLSAPIPLAHSVANMEALACRRAVEFATELRLQRVIFEGDSTIVINAIIQELLDSLPTETVFKIFVVQPCFFSVVCSTMLIGLVIVLLTL